jgi:phosphatidylglycerophosphate synthase
LIAADFPMPESAKPKLRRRSQLLRRLTLLLMRFGVTSEAVAVTGMVLGILAGIAFMATGEISHPRTAWGIGAGLCLLRILAIRLDGMLQPVSSRQSREEEFYNELPERVSDATTLIGFGFAVDSNPWMGLAAALSAIFSAYIRSLAISRLGGSQHTGPVLMTRTHRLALLAVASLPMILEFRSPWTGTTPAELTLYVIVAGCLITVVHRWFLLRGIRV